MCTCVRVRVNVSRDVEGRSYLVWASYPPFFDVSFGNGRSSRHSRQAVRGVRGRNHVCRVPRPLRASPTSTVQSLLLRGVRNTREECPECRKEISLPAGGAAELQGAFFVERMKDVYGKMAVEGKVDAVCEQCGEGKTVAFCRQCAEFICSVCERGHKKMKVFSGHALGQPGRSKKGRG